MRCLQNALIFALLISTPLARLGAEGIERPYFNDLKAPNSVDDLRQIEAALKEVLPQTKAATVCLELGEEKGSGSAVIISPDGLMLTAAHVTGGVNQESTAILADGSRYPVRSLGLLSETDAAMAKIEGDGPFPYVEIDRDASTLLGDWILSLGHSGGYDSDRGIVVRIGRVVRMAQHTWQTDGSLIGGDSGGPLFNFEGELIGIHSRVGKNKVENSHVPIDEFLNNWDDLLAGAFVGEGPFAQRPVGFLGVSLEEEDDEIRIAEIQEDGPAAAKLEIGDVLLKLNGEALESIADLQQKVASEEPGQKVTLTYRRNDEDKEVELELGSYP